jgi:hypothetical protein
MERLSHVECIQSVRLEAGRIAQAAVAGDVDILEACSALGPLLAQSELGPNDADSEIIDLVCSELDGLPIGKVRALWAPEALERLAPQMDSAKLWAISVAMPTLHSIALRFGA